MAEGKVWMRVAVLFLWGFERGNLVELWGSEDGGWD